MYTGMSSSAQTAATCTFNTPWGRKQFLQMPFGISPAVEVMQERNEETFSDVCDMHMVEDFFCTDCIVPHSYILPGWGRGTGRLNSYSASHDN